MQPDFAQAVHLAPRASTVSDWEREVKRPDINLIHAMARLVVASDQAFRYLTSGGEMPQVVPRVRFTEGSEGVDSVAGPSRVAEPSRAVSHGDGTDGALESKPRAVQTALTVREQWERVASSLIAHVHHLITAVPFWDVVGILTAEARYLRERYDLTGNPKLKTAADDTEKLRDQLKEWGEPPGPRSV